MNRGLKYRWIAPRGGGLPEGWEGPELVGRLLRERGVENRADASRFLRPDLSHLHDENLLSNIQVTAQEIVRELNSSSGRPIWILGDYDADGITAAAILYRAIQKIQNDLRIGTLFEPLKAVHCEPAEPALSHLYHPWACSICLYPPFQLPHGCGCWDHASHLVTVRRAIRNGNRVKLLPPVCAAHAERVANKRLTNH